MSADDRIEVDEDMAEFWAEVKDRLPGLLGRDGFVSYPFCSMQSLIHAAVSGGCEGGDGA